MEDAFPKAEKIEESYSDYNQVLTDITRETAIKTAGIVASNPFKVVAIRQIATLAGDSHSTSLKVQLDIPIIFSTLIIGCYHERRSIRRCWTTCFIRSKCYFHFKNAKISLSTTRKSSWN